MGQGSNASLSAGGYFRPSPVIPHSRGRNVESSRFRWGPLAVCAGRAQAQDVRRLRPSASPSSRWVNGMRSSCWSGASARWGLLQYLCGASARPYDPSSLTGLAQHVRAHGVTKAPTPSGPSIGGEERKTLEELDQACGPASGRAGPRAAGRPGCPADGPGAVQHGAESARRRSCGRITNKRVSWSRTAAWG